MSTCSQPLSGKGMWKAERGSAVPPESPSLPPMKQLTVCPGPNGSLSAGPAYTQGRYY